MSAFAQEGLMYMLWSGKGSLSSEECGHGQSKSPSGREQLAKGLKPEHHGRVIQ